MVRRTKEEAAATRELLLDTAEQVFLRQGVARASLNDIATAAGVTRGAIYWHFNDKADLFNAMMERTTLPCEEVFDTLQCSGESDALDVLRRVALQPLHSVRDDERTRRVFCIAIHYTEYSDELQPVRQRHIEAITGYIDKMEELMLQARTQGRLRDGIDPRTAALGLFALIDGLLTHATLVADALPVLDAGTGAIDIYLDGLRAAHEKAASLSQIESA